MNKGSIAMAMIVLVITLPLYSASTLASITTVKVHGKDGIQNLLRDANDYVEFTVTLDEEAAANDLKTDFPEDSFFDSCQQQDNGSVCTYTSDSNDREARAYAYTITLFDNSVVKDTQAGSLYVDGQAPTIESFNAKQEQDNINFSYSVRDRACDDCGSRCSGLVRLSIKEEQVIKRTVEFNSSSCSASGSGSFPVDELATTEGTARICITAIDLFEKQSEPECMDVEVDAVGPQIITGSFRLLDTAGYEINYVPALPLDAVAFINISESNLDSVYGDFSGLNTVNPEKYKNMKAQCSLIVDELYSCEWQGLLVDGASGSVQIGITVSDKTGNTASSTITISLETDTSDPMINRVYTNPDAENLALRNGENAITVELAGSGSGYEKENVYLDLTGFGGAAKAEPEECYEKGSVWLCGFTTSISKQHGYQGYVRVTARDDAGNSMEGAHSVSAVVDADKPVIDSVELSSECAYAGQDLTIDVYVDDDTEIFVTVDASEISTAGHAFSGQCDEEDNSSYLCSVTITDLFTAYVKDTVNINITDAANNVLTKNQLVEVCEEEGTITPNLIEVFVGSPNAVDRRLLSFLSTPVYVPLTLKTKGKVTIIEKYVSCTDSDSAYLLNSESITPTLVAKLKKGSAAEDDTELELSCTLSLIVKKGSKVYSIPEEEKLNITVPLYNNALGEISENMQSKIDSVQDQIEDLHDDIKKWESWNKWLGMLCSTAEMMGQMNSIVQALLQIHWAWTCPAHVACTASPNCEPKPIGAFWNAICGYADKFDNMVQGYLWPVGLKGKPPYIGIGVKYGCLLYSCRLCDATFYVNVGLLAASAAWDSRSVEKIHYDSFDKEKKYPSVYKAKAKSFVDAWQEDGINTRIQSEIDAETWLFNPYKSIHYAKACLCLPGYIYNLKKDRQIKCMYKTCLQENAEVGLPTDTCDYAYKERECLYVDSAQYKLHGYMGGILESLVEALISNLPSILLGIAHDMACGKNKVCTHEPCHNYEKVICGITSAAVMITQIMDFLEGGLDFSKYEAKLKGRDYCSGGGS